jgi:hypothetical protein
MRVQQQQGRGRTKEGSVKNPSKKNSALQPLAADLSPGAVQGARVGAGGEGEGEGEGGDRVSVSERLLDLCAHPVRNTRKKDL